MYNCCAKNLNLFIHINFLINFINFRVSKIYFMNNYINILYYVMNTFFEKLIDKFISDDNTILIDRN